MAPVKFTAYVILIVTLAKIKELFDFLVSFPGNLWKEVWRHVHGRVVEEPREAYRQICTDSCCPKEHLRFWFPVTDQGFFAIYIAETLLLIVFIVGLYRVFLKIFSKR